MSLYFARILCVFVLGLLCLLYEDQGLRDVYRHGSLLSSDICLCEGKSLLFLDQGLLGFEQGFPLVKVCLLA